MDVKLTLERYSKVPGEDIEVLNKKVLYLHGTMKKDVLLLEENYLFGYRVWFCDKMSGLNPE